MRILYFIYGFDPGGAEHGLLTLLRAGFFSGHQVKILACCRGRGGLLSMKSPHRSESTILFWLRRVKRLPCDPLWARSL